MSAPFNIIKSFVRMNSSIFNVIVWISLAYPLAIYCLWSMEGRQWARPDLSRPLSPPREIAGLNCQKPSARPLRPTTHCRLHLSTTIIAPAVPPRNIVGFICHPSFSRPQGRRHRPSLYWAPLDTFRIAVIQCNLLICWS